MMELIKQFSTKKDAITSVKQIILALEQNDNIDKWRETLIQLESYEDRDLAQQVLDYFNEVNDTRYQNTEKIKSIIRQMPKLTFDQFRSVILHKKETWGGDPKMEQYLRPATLFGSKNKFQNYLEDAQHYWIKKLRTIRQEGAIGEETSGGL